MENINASSSGTFRKDIAEEQEKAKWADNFIFISPIWWGSVNAMLTGYFDVVFTAGVAWGFQNMMDKGLFKGKKALTAVTTSVKEEEFAPGKFADMSIEALIHGKTKATLYFCGVEVLPTFAAHNVVMGDDNLRKDYLKKWRETLSQFESTKPLFGY